MARPPLLLSFAQVSFPLSRYATAARPTPAGEPLRQPFGTHYRLAYLPTYSV